MVNAVEQYAVLASDEIEHHVIRRPGQTLVPEPVGFMTRRSKVVQQLDREILVELEPHTGLSGRRLSSRPSPSARLSRMTVTSTLVPLAQSCPLHTLGSLVRCSR